MFTYLHDVKDVLAVNLCTIRIDVAQETHQLLVRDVTAGKVDCTALFLTEVIRESRLKVG